MSFHSKNVRIWKKRKIASIFAFFLSACALTLCGCGNFFASPSHEDVSLRPLDVTFFLYANDPVSSDSAAAHLSTGVLMPVEPGGSYTLSFDADSSKKPPKMHIFRLVNRNDTLFVGSRVRELEPVDSLGRLFYRFECGEASFSYWAPILVEGSSYYSGKVQNLSLEGVGSYSPRFSLNLIVTGSYGGTSDSVSVDSLSKLLLSEFRSAFFPGGIFIDTIYVHRASERSSLSSTYPDDVPWLAGKSSPDYFLSELGGFPNSEEEPDIYNALDLVLVHRIESPGVLGYSVLFGGNLGGGVGSTVVIGTHYYLSAFSEYSQTAREIVETAVHESGHFFGLRHTTSTVTDIENSGDASIVEDGIEDTPYCGSPIRAKSLRVSLSPFFLPMPRTVLFKTSERTCPDADNPMFPTVNALGMEPFTEGQLSLFKKNLQLYPH